MKTTKRQELLKLVDALFEGTASVADYARIEELCLVHPECREYYLELVELQGMLHWDAAGIGADILPEPVRVSRFAGVLKRVGHPRVWFGPAVACAVAVMLYFSPSFQQNNGQGPVVVNHDEVDPDPVPFPEMTDPVTLPSVTLPVNSGKNVADNDTIVAPVKLAVEEPPILTAYDDATVVSFINEQIESGWESGGVSPSGPANDAEWVRRVHLDLAGRIPTKAEASAFLSDRESDKDQQLVESLVESRDFSRNFATQWTTLLVGRTRNSEIDRPRLLSYLQRQFGENRSWRETVTDLITAQGSSEESAPANFLLAHLNNEAVPATAITARVFLCQQLQCAQCHRHPSTATWGQDAFWQMNAFFEQTQIENESVTDQETGETVVHRRLVDNAGRGPAFYETPQGVMKVAYPLYDGQKVPDGENVVLREELAGFMTTGGRSQLARAFVNRTWNQLFGHGFTIDIEDMGPHSHVSHPELLDGLTEAFVNSGYDVKKLVRWVCLTDAYRLSSRSHPLNETDTPDLGELPLFTRMYVKPLSAEQLFDSLRVASGSEPEDFNRSSNGIVERDKWIRQFFTATDTEENNELTTFDGTLPQALAMMNGELVQDALHPERGAVLNDILSRGGSSEIEKIRALSLAALSRYPTSEELNRIRQVLRVHVKQRTERRVPVQVAVNEGLRDIYWAYLNSAEFAVNH